LFQLGAIGIVDHSPPASTASLPSLPPMRLRRRQRERAQQQSAALGVTSVLMGSASSAASSSTAASSAQSDLLLQLAQFAPRKSIAVLARVSADAPITQSLLHMSMRHW
jgi:hypothetical protein